MRIGKTTVALSLVCTAITFTSVFAAPNRVRVVNETKKPIYIHKGGYAQSEKIAPGQWKIFNFPFQIVPPNSEKKVSSSLLVATSGGRWMTTPNGYTYLSKPNMMICLDYNSPENQHKTGNRVWSIKRAAGFDPGCKIKGYQQPWFQSPKQ